MVVPLHNDHPPIMDLSAPMDFTPSNTSQTVGPFAFPFGAPNIFLGSFWSLRSIPLCPNPRVLFTIWPPDDSGICFYSLTKWPKEYDRILAFIHEVSSREIHFCFPFNLMHLLFFNSYIYLIMCKSIIPRTKLILFLPTFLGTFLFFWRGWLVHEHKA